MPFTLNDILFGGVVPVIVAAVILAVTRRFKSDAMERYSASIAVAAAFFAGYGLLSLAPWSPSTHWHWFPYAVLVSAIVGPITCASGLMTVERGVLFVLAALVTGWVLVPTWEDLDPSRMTHLVTYVVYVSVWSLLFRPLVSRNPGPMLPIVLWATMTAISVLLALAGSLRFAQLAIALSGGLFGIVLIAFFRRDQQHLRGITLLMAIAGIGALLIGRVNSFSEVPLASYVMIPIAPLTAWIGSVGPPTQWTGAKRVAAVVALPLLVLAVAIGIAAAYELSGGSEY